MFRATVCQWYYALAITCNMGPLYYEVEVLSITGRRVFCTAMFILLLSCHTAEYSGSVILRSGSFINYGKTCSLKLSARFITVLPYYEIRWVRYITECRFYQLRKDVFSETESSFYYGLAVLRRVRFSHSLRSLNYGNVSGNILPAGFSVKLSFFFTV